MNKRVSILRVFVNNKKEFGNPVGIIVDEKQEIGIDDRQRVASNLGLSESVFINSVSTGAVSIFNPKNEVNFAGHALVGTAYFIHTVLKKHLEFLECRAGRVSIWQVNALTWIRASVKNTPSWIHEQLQSVSLVENYLPALAAVKQHTVIWAWIDKRRGTIRARTFAPDWNIPEDEANGSGSMQLAVKLQQKLEIHHGKGSVIYANPINIGSAEAGGRVEIDAFQEIDI